MKPLLFILLLVSADAMAQFHNSLLSKDKRLHLSTGMFLGVAGYGIFATATSDINIRYKSEWALFTGFATGTSIGLVKEAFDSAEGGSGWNNVDLAYTALGALSSSLVIYGINKIKRGVKKRRRRKYYLK